MKINIPRKVLYGMLAPFILFSLDYILTSTSPVTASITQRTLMKPWVSLTSRLQSTLMTIQVLSTLVCFVKHTKMK